MTDRFDVAIIGAGIVGLATADAIRRAAPDRSIVVLEKEPTISSHQTGRNSGVIHSGLYYASGSLKAELCVAGGPRLFQFCAEHGIATTQTGKIVVATETEQLPALDELQRRARANGVIHERLGSAGIGEHEPYARGVEALWVPFTGAVAFSDVARALAAGLTESGHAVKTGFEVRTSVGESGQRRLIAPAGEVTAGVVVNCAGLHVDRVMRMLGGLPDLKILPFRGEYWGLTESAATRVRGHIYPVPDPRLPHLGVHFTRSAAGHVELGPNAVWAWGREAYGRMSGHPRDALETLGYKGFWKLAETHWKTAIGEQWRSLVKRACLRDARALMPVLELEDLAVWRSGIRAQAVTPDGSLVHDFLVREDQGVVNVLNAPSPAATSCLSIGEYIAKRALRQLAS